MSKPRYHFAGDREYIEAAIAAADFPHRDTLTVGRVRDSGPFKRAASVLSQAAGVPEHSVPLAEAIALAEAELITLWTTLAAAQLMIDHAKAAMGPEIP